MKKLAILLFIVLISHSVYVSAQNNNIKLSEKEYQAENADKLSGCFVKSAYSGYTGSGYVEMGVKGNR